MDPQVDRDRPIALPLELFRPILEHLSGHTRSVLACSKVSRALCAEAQRILFRVVIDVDNRTIMFLNSVLNSPDRLALHVRVFNTKRSRSDLFPEWHHTTLSDALKVMHNLKHLRLCLHPIAPLLRDVRFQLESLEISAYKCEQEIGIDFLPHQRSLKYISVYNWTRTNAQGVDLKDACPNLECIEGPTDFVYAFLADRGARAPKTVLWQPDRNTRTWQIFDAGKVAASLHHIEYMTYMALKEHSGQGLLEKMYPRLKSLIVLEIVLVLSMVSGCKSTAISTVTTDARSSYCVLKDMQMLQHLPKLEHLILSFPSLKSLRRNGSVWLNEHAQRGVKAVEETFAHSQTVQWVDVKSLRPEDEDCYMRWRRPSLKVPPERIGVHDSSWTVHAHWYRYRGVFSPPELWI